MLGDLDISRLLGAPLPEASIDVSAKSTPADSYPRGPVSVTILGSLQT